MTRVEVRVIEGDPVKVGDQRISLGETKAVDVSDGTSISRAEPPKENSAQAPTDDVWGENNRPNGAMTAQIAPKMPKVSGELMQVKEGEGNSYAEVQVAPRGEAEKGGGPNAEPGFKTPGPQPDNTGVNAGMTGNQSAAATVPKGKAEDQGKGPASQTPEKKSSRR